MTDCPYCERSVLPANGRCPSCQGDLTNQAAMSRQLVKREAAARARLARENGAALGELEDVLVDSGLTPAEVHEVMADFEGRSPRAMKEQDEYDMRHGKYWLVGGIAVTSLTYLMAESSERGGWYVIAWGPVVAGAIQFMRAWLRSRESGGPPAD